MSTSTNPPSTSATKGSQYLQCGLRHRHELRKLTEDAIATDKTLAEHLKGIVVTDKSSQISFWVLRLVNRSQTQSYRAGEALASDHYESLTGSARWVTVNSRTTLRHLLNKYGERLLGFEAREDEWSVEVLALEVLDSSIKTVRVLVSD